MPVRVKVGNCARRGATSAVAGVNRWGAGSISGFNAPAGVGAARTPPRWLVDGDVVEITIEGVGTLGNPVIRRDSAYRSGT